MAPPPTPATPATPPTIPPADPPRDTVEQPAADPPPPEDTAEEPAVNPPADVPPGPEPEETPDDDDSFFSCAAPGPGSGVTPFGSLALVALAWAVFFLRRRRNG